MKRRKFIQSSLAGSMLFFSTLSVLSKGSKLKILMLGGTNFVGPHLVKAALANGHEVTLFNRGITNPDLFSDLELIKGNRYPEKDNGLNGLKGQRKWDAVIDTWQAEPGCVNLTAELLNKRSDRYVYISSIAIYKNFKLEGIDESYTKIEAEELMDSFKTDLNYSIRKRAAEQSVESILGNRGTILRCGSIQGESSKSENFSPGYWEYNFRQGNPLIIPDDPTAKFQLIDVKDMAAFATRTIENSLGGAYNIVGPNKPLLFRDEYIKTWHEITDKRSKLIYKEPEWLLNQGVKPWIDIPHWIPMNDSEPGFYQVNNEKAVKNGLKFRSLQATLSDNMDKIPEANSSLNGLTKNRIQELLQKG